MSSFITAMKTNVSMYMLQAVLNYLSSEQVKIYTEKLLNYITEKVLGSSSKVDDNLVFPIIGALRAMLSLPADTKIDTRTLSAITSALMGLFDSAQLKSFADITLDMLEDCIAESVTTLDDRFAIPVLRAFRVSFDIPDNDPVK